MSITTDQYERIIRFLDANMEPAEMDIFEQELAANPGMRRQLDFEQSIRDDLALLGDRSLRDDLSRGDRSVRDLSPLHEGSSMRWWSAAAAAVIVGCTLFIVFWQKPSDRDRIVVQTPVQGPVQGQVNEPVKDSVKGIDLARIFKRYFKKEALPEQYPVYLADAFTDYESGHYKKLMQLDLSNIPQSRGSGDADSKEEVLRLGYYYKGLAFLQTNNAREAIVNLDRVLAHQPDPALKARTLWYQALAYLDEGDAKKASQLCERIVKDKADLELVKKAKEILTLL